MRGMRSGPIGCVLVAMMKQKAFQRVLSTQADVANFWTKLRRPVVLTGHDLWFVLLGPDARPLPFVEDLRGLPIEADREIARRLVAMWGRARAKHVSVESVAVLLSRPGLVAVQESDRAWARVLTDEAAAAGLPMEVIHVASHRGIRPLPLDEVA